MPVAVAAAVTVPVASGAIIPQPTMATGILVSNQTRVTINTFAIAEDALPLWDPPQCIVGTTILAGETTTLVWASVYQYGASKTRYRLMWWRDKVCSSGTDSELRGVVTVVR